MPNSPISSSPSQAVRTALVARGPNYERLRCSFPQSPISDADHHLARLSHLEGISTNKCNGMRKRYPKVFTTKVAVNYLPN
jgi:hypothetical protein